MDVASLLSTVPPIVEAIFKHLNWRDLDSCSAVCELWQRVAKTERRKRGEIFWFFQSQQCCHTHNPDDPTFKFQDIERDLRARLKDKGSRPYYCLTFATRSLLKHFNAHFGSSVSPSSPPTKKIKQQRSLEEKTDLKTAFRIAVGQFLPEECNTAFIVAPGIISCDLNCVPFGGDGGCAISGFMIPAIPGLEVYNFPIVEETVIISNLIPVNSRIKCLLVYLTPDCIPAYENMIRQCIREETHLAIGGAVINHSEHPSGSVVVFCGENVEAASVVIKLKDDEAEVERKLKRFRKFQLLQNRCFVFRFVYVNHRLACPSFDFRKHDLEESIFHRLYPTIPVFGVFGNGEIGYEFPCFPYASPIFRFSKLNRCRKTYSHSYTTVFVLISLKYLH